LYFFYKSSLKQRVLILFQTQTNNIVTFEVFNTATVKNAVFCGWLRVDLVRTDVSEEHD
jgi:hypothetical protein